MPHLFCSFGFEFRRGVLRSLIMLECAVLCLPIYVAFLPLLAYQYCTVPSMLCWCRMRKLMHRVVFPFDLKPSNVTTDAEGGDSMYSLFAVVVHVGSGPHHGEGGRGVGQRMGARRGARRGAKGGGDKGQRRGTKRDKGRGGRR